MNTRLIRAIDTFCSLAETLNQEILSHGEIQKNNSQIWKQFLHRFTNRDWENLAAVVAALSETEYVTADHISHFDEVLTVIDKHGDYYERVMDMRKHHINHKPLAWKAMMIVREIYCDIQGVWLPNSDSSKLTHSETLFEIT